jgi:MFS family permease
VTDTHLTERQRTGLQKHQIRGTLTSLNWNFSLRNIFGTIAGSSSFVFVAFALEIGVKKEQMGWIATLVSAACLAQMGGLLLANRVRNKKRMIVRLSLIEPLVLIAAIAITPFLPGIWKLYGLALGTFASSALLNLTRPLADDWTASAIPSGLRENFLGRRSQIMCILSIGATLGTGYAADRVTRFGVTGLAILLVFGALFGVFAALPLKRAVLPSVTARASVTWDDLKEVPRDHTFRRYLLVISIICIPFYLAAPFYQVFNLQVLHLSKVTIAYISVGYMIVRLILSQFSARWVSRLGPNLMLQGSCVLYIIFFFSFTLTLGGQAWPIFVGWALIGAGDAIFNVAQGTALFAAVPHTHARSAYFAAYNLLILSSYGIGGLVAMPMLEWFKEHPIIVGPWTMSNFHCLFFVVFILMVVCSIVLLFVPLSPTPPRATRANEAAA